MNREEHLLTIAQEECAEITQRLCKAARFGLAQIQQDSDDKPEENPLKLTNYERILEEYAHLIAVMEMLGIYIDDLIPQEKIDKKKRVEKYLLRSKSLGKLNG